MNKDQYLKELKQRLKQLPQKDIDDAILYCEEYFDEAGEENFEAAYADLGAPLRFSTNIKAEYAIRQNDEEHLNNKVKSKDRAKNIWMIILGILSAPLSVSLLLVILCFVFAFLLIMFIPFLVLGILLVTFFFIAIILFVIAIKILFASFGSALLLLGGSLVMISLCLYVFWLFKCYITSIIPFTSRVLGKAFIKTRGGKQNEEI